MAIARHKTRQRELREERALTRRVQRGDRRAFELLYASYEGRLYRFCHRLTGSDAAAAARRGHVLARARDLAESGLDAVDVPAPCRHGARARLRAADERRGALARPHRGRARARGRRRQPAAVRRGSAWRSHCATSRGVRTTRSRSRSARGRIVAALVARARLRLRDELELPGPGASAGPSAGLSAYVDARCRSTAPGARDPRRRLCGCRAALFASRGSGAALPLAARPCAARRAAVANDGRARRGRIPDAAAARARARSRARERGPAAGGGRRRGCARGGGRRRHDHRLARRAGQRRAHARSAPIRRRVRGRSTRRCARRRSRSSATGPPRPPRGRRRPGAHRRPCGTCAPVPARPARSGARGVLRPSASTT